MPLRLARQRSWPSISGSSGDLEEAIAWHRRLAKEMGIRLMRLRPGVGEAGLYSQPEQTIYLADELFDHAPLYGWVLAHEMGHAADPRFVVLGGYEYGQEGMSHKTRDYELIAEASAKAAFDLSVCGCLAGSITSRFSVARGGRTVCANPEFDNRFIAVSGPMKRPLPQGTPEQQREHRRAWDRIRTSEHLARRDAEEDLRHYENPWGAFKKAKKLHKRF